MISACHSQIDTSRSQTTELQLVSHFLVPTKECLRVIKLLPSFSKENSTCKIIFQLFSTRSYLETKGWDVFRNLPPEQDSSSEAMNKKCMAITVRVLKVFAYILCFAVVLGGAVVSKATYLFMTSQVRPRKQQMHCNKDLQRDKTYISEISNAEMVAWSWLLMGAFIVPELGTFIRSARICVFKSCRRSTLSDFLVVMVFELLHTVGMALLTFIVLPELDVIKGAMLTNCMAFIPALFCKYFQTGQQRFNTELPD